MITLRPYQKEPVSKAVEFFMSDNAEPALMVCPTGYGKSIIVAEAAAACPDPILVVQPSKELLEQNLEKYRLLCGALAPAGVFSAAFGKKEIDHVTFATIGSVKSVGARFRELGFRKMIIDEAHLYPRKERSMLGEFLSQSGIHQVLGLTATPLKLEQHSEKQGDRFDKWSQLTMLTNPSPDGTFFKHMLHVSQIQEMTSSGFWSPLIYEQLPFDKNVLKYNSSMSDYSDDSVVDAYTANNTRANIFAALDWHRERRRAIVFVPSVEEAAILAQSYPGSAYVCGETPPKERAYIFARFRAGEIRVLFGVSVFGVGFDCPQIDMIILATPTASVARYYQYTGRGVRICEGKRDCLVVDMAGNLERFGRIEDLRFEHNGRWRLYGSGGRLLSGIPINCIGSITKKDITAMLSRPALTTLMSFGKHAGKPVELLPVSYITWYLTSNGRQDEYLRCAMIRALENHIKDTTRDAPLTVIPDGKHAGASIYEVPRGYLAWYYGAQSWNETNDSLRRGLEMALGGVPSAMKKTA